MDIVLVPLKGNLKITNWMQVVYLGHLSRKTEVRGMLNCSTSSPVSLVYVLPYPSTADMAPCGPVRIHGTFTKTALKSVGLTNCAVVRKCLL